MPLLPLKKTAADLAVSVVDSTRANAAPASVGVGVVLVSLLMALSAQAQPMPVDPTTVDGVIALAQSGSPWAMVAMALVFLLQQLGSNIKDWSKARQVRGVELEAQLGQLQQSLLEERAARARAEARLEVLQEAREDARRAEHPAGT